MIGGSGGKKGLLFESGASNANGRAPEIHLIIRVIGC